nr:DUF2515 family protein [Sutcliffiella rhizosphaerae]
MDIQKRRKRINFSFQENKFITTIKKNTVKYNVDNISRTKAYAMFYKSFPEVKWSFLASMVSRNAGWNMTDLEGKWFKLALDARQRLSFFLTYELANWTIFRDAFPQLLLYRLSLYYNKPLFHLLKAFNVSCFMEAEWQWFWENKDEKRLINSLIINEQNIIQEPVLHNHLLRKKVFGTVSYIIQDFGHYSCVVFPTLEGKLYGFSVHGFQKLDNRISLGQKLASLLFSPIYSEKFHQFSEMTEHSGSRYDYEQYISRKLYRETPILRSVYPVIAHPLNESQKDWVFIKKKKLKKWSKRTDSINSYPEITKWFIHKQHQMQGIIALKHGL